MALRGSTLTLRRGAPRMACILWLALEVSKACARALICRHADADADADADEKMILS